MDDAAAGDLACPAPIMGAGELTYRKESAVCHVLIIEDEVLIAFDLQDLLQAEGATSFAFAETQEAAVAAARVRRPDFITSDVTLLEGTGPRAVATILDEMGPVPVIFITAMSEDCVPCEPPARILCKPLQHRSIATAFREMTPIH